MRARLEHPAPQPDIAVAPTEDPRPPAPDPDRGLGLLMSFVGALSVMVAVVLVVGAVEQSWILIPGFVVLLLMAAGVFAEIMSLLADGEDTAHRAR